ncbi:LacI family DNA-binding transcriptional regulator [Alkalihalobacterium chitinilyticum]|uniref:LacI family transcriptional regulator n=1 Tax=Alkalihalobacterium chitinilyticum TaxID=2980103 RepID=A0ABT5VHX1_9BACI|nr:LacI family DNA-binding transcriptional regulator [Alkalihalobacterium chitinilyticum]MDE5415060.1 LacI family transcriptional regulator [Alkalihalobacterium chitinilyticum]
MEDHMTTIKDIAKAAGTSVTTVSRALNGHSDVSAKTMKHIKEIADRLNYSPNVVARSLVMKKSKTIGLLVSEISREGTKDNFTFEVLCGINDCAAEYEYDPILFNTNTSKQRIKSYTQLCRERKVDGVILQGMKKDDPYLIEVVESDIPCVLIDIPITGKNVGYVSTNNQLGARRAIEHLVELGHQHIGFINGHEQAYVSEERFKGYKQAIQEAGLELREEWVVNGQFSERTAEFTAKKLLATYPQITALFCASDLMALGAVRAANSLGRKVPDSLSIVGFDDIVLAQYASPALTTISQNKYLMGYQAANMLIGLLEEKETNKSVLIENQLIVRESTAENKLKEWY